jgi:exonuclease SbcD
MKNLIFTDLHIADTNINICNEFLSSLLKYLKENNIENIFFLGDLYDYKKGPSEVVLTYSLLFINELLKNTNQHIYLIPGNHDKYIADGLESYLNILIALDKKRLHILKDLFVLEGQEYDYVFFPYFEGEHFEKAIGRLDYAQFDKPIILFAHYMYEQIPQEIKKKFKKIFLGHNHDRSDFPNGMYIGSCFPQNFSEDNNKGFTILYDDLTTELIPFTSQEYITQKIDINAFEEEQIKEYIQKFKNENPNKLLRVEFVGYNKDISNLKNFCKKLNIYYTLNIDNNVINQKEEVLNISQFSSNQIKKQFENFCQENNISKDIKNKILSILIKS